MFFMFVFSFVVVVFSNWFTCYVYLLFFFVNNFIFLFIFRTLGRTSVLLSIWLLSILTALFSCLFSFLFSFFVFMHSLICTTQELQVLLIFVQFLFIKSALCLFTLQHGHFFVCLLFLWCNLH